MEMHTGLRLDFSESLSEALTEAFSEKGITVSIHEHGDEPIRITGTYALEKEHVSITVKACVMGTTASRDIAAADVKISREKIDESLLIPKFSHITETLVTLLEQNYHGPGELPVVIEPFTPGLKNQPYLLLGQEIRKHLENALNSSEVFTHAPGTFGQEPSTMKGTYSRVEEKVSFNIKVAGPSGKLWTSASFEVDAKYIPQNLFEEVIPDVEIRACTVYECRSGKCLKNDHQAVESLLGFIEDTLSECGVKAVTCQENNNGARKIEVAFELAEQKISSPFKLARGKVFIKVLGPEGEVLGSVTKNGKAPYREEIDGAASKIIEDMIEKGELKKDIREIMLKR